MESNFKVPDQLIPIINYDETPFLNLEDSINIIISVEESTSLFFDVYRGRIGDLGKSNMSDILPMWVQDWVSTVIKWLGAYHRAIHHSKMSRNFLLF